MFWNRIKEPQPKFRIIEVNEHYVAEAWKDKQWQGISRERDTYLWLYEEGVWDSTYERYSYCETEEEAMKALIRYIKAGSDSRKVVKLWYTAEEVLEGAE